MSRINKMGLSVCIINADHMIGEHNPSFPLQRPGVAGELR
jgi:hypothetical protein